MSFSLIYPNCENLKLKIKQKIVDQTYNFKSSHSNHYKLENTKQYI